jgi:hypothetical protein
VAKKEKKKNDTTNAQLEHGCSDCVQRSNIADGGDFKALLLHHCTKFNSSTNAQLWHVCPTIGNILLAAVNIFKMETINVELRLDHKVDIDVRLDDIIDGIYSCEMKRRWNYIALILNDVQLNLSDLTDEQRAIIKKYLTDKLSLF